MYNTRVPTSMAPLVHYRAPRRLVPLLAGPEASYKGARTNGAL
jgi:hypothetical protein